ELDARSAAHTGAPRRRHPFDRSRTAGAGLRRRTPHTRCGGTEGRVITQTSPATTRPAPDPYQQKVIDATERSIRVVAPAGSGKTETLARRVEERIRQGIPPHRILVLTFDRNAAESFRSKMRNGNGGPGARVETLNAYGFALLRQRFPDERNRIINEPYWPGTT